MEVSKEKNYIARNCKRNKFARIVAAVCPKAGEAKKIEHSLNCRPDPGHRCPSDLKKTPRPHIGIAVQI